MTLALALLVALQQDPRVEKVERLVGNVNRPLLWTPLKVTLSSASGFSGSVVARSGFGFAVARDVTVRPGGREVVLLPALDPTEVAAGGSTFRLPRSFARPDLVVLVDARLDYAAELVSTEKVLYQTVAPEDLSQTGSRGLLEAADLVLVRDPGGDGVVAPGLEEARRAVARATGRAPTLELADRNVWSLAPQDRWVPTKRAWALYFSGLYAFVAFVTLAWVPRTFPRFGWAAVVAVAILGLAGFACFPRSHMWAVSQSVEVVPASGDAREYRLWFLQSALETTVREIAFPRLVKPVFPSMGGTDDPFTIRVGDKGCTVEGLRLLPGRPACFGGGEPRPAAARAPGPLPEPLRQAVLVRGGRAAYLGDLPAGASVSSAAGPEPLPAGTPFDAWKRFAGSDSLFGIAGRGERPAADVRSPDLFDEHERPPVWILRFP